MRVPLIGVVGAARLKIMADSKPQDETLLLTRSQLAAAIRAELEGYFSDPRVSGLALQKTDAAYIAGRIAFRVAAEASGDVAQA